MKNKYREKQDMIRNEAIEYQESFSQGKQWYYSEIADITEYFYKQGKRYGLLKEFKENGII